MKYFNYTNVFFVENIAEIPENTKTNKHIIELEEGKQPPFSPTYSLGPVKLKTLKTYIKINLANGFIRSSKSPTGASILFDRKLDTNLHLYINYWSLNNITIKNQYLLYLIGKLLDWLGWARRFN